jgi:hypothetical protein
MFAAPRDAFDAPPPQHAREEGGRRFRRKTGAQKSGGDDAPTANQIVQRACDQFNFGKFGHKNRG